MEIFFDPVGSSRLWMIPFSNEYSQMRSLSPSEVTSMSRSLDSTSACISVSAASCNWNFFTGSSTRNVSVCRADRKASSSVRVQADPFANVTKTSTGFDGCGEKVTTFPFPRIKKKHLLMVFSCSVTKYSKEHMNARNLQPFWDRQKSLLNRSLYPTGTVKTMSQPSTIL